MDQSLGKRGGDSEYNLTIFATFIGSFRQSTLFASIAAQLLGVIKSDQTTTKADGFILTFLHVVSYAAIFFNGIATAASGFLIDRLCDIEFNQARKKRPERVKPFYKSSKSTLKLLLHYGASPNLRWIFYQCKVSPPRPNRILTNSQGFSIFPGE
jgi:hypothetical protein